MFDHWMRYHVNHSLDTVPISNRVVGSLYFSFSLCTIIPYTLCLWCIIIDTNLRNKPSYIIIFHIGVADILQLIFNGLCAGVFTFFGTTWGFVPNKVIGGIMNVGWVVYTALAHVLSLNRFIVLCKPHLEEQWFSKCKTNILMAFCWLYGLVWLIVYMCPDLSVTFNVVYRNWDYDQRYLPSRILWLIELIQDSIHFFMSVLWYTHALLAVRKTVSKISDERLNESNVRREKKVLIQAMLICAMIGLTLIGFFAVPLLFHDSPWSTTLSNFIWLACCGNNCAIYIKFNGTIRRRMIAKFRCGNDHSPSIPPMPVNHRKVHPTPTVPNNVLMITNRRDIQPSRPNGKQPTGGIASDMHAASSTSRNDSGEFLVKSVPPSGALQKMTTAGQPT